MAKKCSICSNITIFYIWSSSRKFPVNKYIRKKNLDTEFPHSKKMIYEIKHSGFPVCFKCYEELKSK